jgi:hypothetical protein
MGLASDFQEFMKKTVSIEPFLGNDGYKNTYGPAVSYPCEIQEKVTKIEKDDGTVFISTAQIYLDGSATVTAQDRITFDGKSPVINAIKIEHEFGIPYSNVIYV